MKEIRVLTDYGRRMVLEAHRSAQDRLRAAKIAMDDAHRQVDLTSAQMRCGHAHIEQRGGVEAVQYTCLDCGFDWFD